MAEILARSHDGQGGFLIVAVDIDNQGKIRGWTAHNESRLPAFVRATWPGDSLEGTLEPMDEISRNIPTPQRVAYEDVSVVTRWPA